VADGAERAPILARTELGREQQSRAGVERKFSQAKFGRRAEQGSDQRDPAG
jgi:hypothetical protein